jgi:hypothetical protein
LKGAIFPKRAVQTDETELDFLFKENNGKVGFDVNRDRAKPQPAERLLNGGAGF